VAQYTENSKY